MPLIKAPDKLPPLKLVLLYSFPVTIAVECVYCCCACPVSFLTSDSVKYGMHFKMSSFDISGKLDDM